MTDMFYIEVQHKLCGISVLLSLSLFYHTILCVYLFSLFLCFSVCGTFTVSLQDNFEKYCERYVRGIGKFSMAVRNITSFEETSLDCCNCWKVTHTHTKTNFNVYIKKLCVSMSSSDISVNMVNILYTFYYTFTHQAQRREHVFLVNVILSFASCKMLQRKNFTTLVTRWPLIIYYSESLVTHQLKYKETILNHFTISILKLFCSGSFHALKSKVKTWRKWRIVMKVFSKPILTKRQCHF